MNHPFLSTACLLIGMTAGLEAALDRNANGMCDVWEARFAAQGIAPEGDADGNGVSNLEESIAGTNPFVANSRFQVLEVSSAAGMVIKVSSVPGKSYRLFTAPNPAGPWTALGSELLASTGEMTFPSQAPGGGAKFYRAEVKDVDSDGDGLSNWAERQIIGLNPQEADSFAVGNANADFAFAETWLDQLSSGGLEVESLVGDAFEKNAPGEASEAVLRLTRPTPYDRPFTVYLRSAPALSATGGAADAMDFRLKDSSGNEITDQFVIPAGQASAQVHLQAVADSQAEVPEEWRFHIGGSPNFLSGRVCDARPTEANVRLLVAYLSPRPGVSSLGSGLSAIRLAGDHSSAIVTVSFTNLSSVASSAHIETSGGATMLSIPPFRYNGQPWPIRASASFTKDQQVLDALLSGALQFNVYSETATSGEIAGLFQGVTGSTVFQAPPAPEPVTTVTGDALDREIVRFLTQASFGARMEDIISLRSRVISHGGDHMAAFEEWIDEQIALTPPSHVAMTAAANALEKSVSPTATLDQTGRQVAWWTIAMNAPDQLRQRMTYALSQIFVISDEEPTLERMGVAVASYYDMLQGHAFGNYRELLEGVTLDPNMGQYLSHLRNQKAQVSGGVTLSSPDENYAREIMQLFSIGLVGLHPDGTLILGADGLPVPTYDQEDITEIARVFTGWSFSKRSNGTSSTETIDNTNFFLGSSFEEHAIRWSHPMKLFPAYHDEGAKNFLGFSLPARAGGGVQDLEETLDFLASHPNTAPFISKQLIQRFTSANPSAGYVHRVASAFEQADGDFAAVLKAILLDPEARNPVLANSGVGSGKVKEPLIRHASLLRAIGARSAIPIALFENFGYPPTETAKFPAGARMVRFQNTTSGLVQKPVGPPTVFNWYRPDYAPAGALAENGFASPEFQIVNETTIVRAINYHYSPIYDSNGQTTDSLPAGLNIAGVPGFTAYDGNSDNMVPDFAPFRALYLSLLDTNADGAFSNADTTWANRATLVPQAIERVLDHADLLLCAGSLKERYGSRPGTPRHIIFEAAKAIESQDNNNTSATEQTNSMNERIRDILYLITKSPDFIIQK
ncbi:MAG: DUF1800 family protein [Akkermansiaceae bacterium]|nr:DUF1800 family protein [Akkermansiaceae bacterium]